MSAAPAVKSTTVVRRAGTSGHGMMLPCSS
jgi:hypothetical protein